MDWRQFYINYVLGAYLGTLICYSYAGGEAWLGSVPLMFGFAALAATVILMFATKIGKNWSIWIPRIVMAVIALIILVPQYVTWRPFFMTKNKIKEYCRRYELQPLLTEYGRSPEEAMRVMHLEKVRLNDAESFREMWFNIMNDDSHKIIKDICGEIFGKMPGTLAESYDLIWLMSICDNPHKNRLSKSQLYSLAGASNKQILSLLPINYHGSMDRVSMLFAVISGSYINQNVNESRHKEISGYFPSLVYNLSFGDDGLISDEQTLYLPVGPYAFLSSRNENALEEVLKDIDDSNVDEMAKKWGVDLPRDDKVSFLRKELSYYGNVFTRSSVPEFPNITGVSWTNAEKLLSYFTNKELAQHFEPRLPWTQRKELLRVIYDDVNGDARWSLISTSHCKNDETINIMTGELHGDEDKRDINEPTLSYGTWNNYRCYQISELIGCFAEFEGVFVFRVPDWVTGENFPREFPIDSIRQLQKLLEKEPSHPRISELLNRINFGLRTMKDAKQRIRAMENDYRLFTDEEKRIVELYFAWLFCYGMWMRFWDGPGSQWPVKETGRILLSEVRDAHVIIQDMVRSRIVETYEKNLKLKKWIDDLPVIYIDLTSNEPATCASHTVYSIMEQINTGTYCMGFGSDTILKTGYFFITELLKHTEGNKFNSFMNEKIPLLLELEGKVLEKSRSNPSLASVCQTRLNKIQAGFVAQPGFTSHKFRNNRHT